MITLVKEADLPALWSFLKPRAATCMFLCANLKDHGLGNSDSAFAMTLWMASDETGIIAVFGISNSGVVLCECTDIDPNWSDDLRRALAGRDITCLSGEARQIETLTAALGLENAGRKCEEAEPLFRLDLDNLVVPDGVTTLRDMQASDLPLVTKWRMAFEAEAFDEPDTPALHARSKARADLILHSGDGRLLEQDGTPVAMTSFNAALDDIAQIGSVFTPPALRGQGHARRAVALHLDQMRATGITTAILFALSPAAVRAYQSIGFERIGAYSIIDFATPITLKANA